MCSDLISREMISKYELLMALELEKVIREIVLKSC